MYPKPLLLKGFLDFFLLPGKFREEFKAAFSCCQRKEQSQTVRMRTSTDSRKSMSTQVINMDNVSRISDHLVQFLWTQFQLAAAQIWRMSPSVFVFGGWLFVTITQTLYSTRSIRHNSIQIFICWTFSDVPKIIFSVECITLLWSVVRVYVIVICILCTLCLIGFLWKEK